MELRARDLTLDLTSLVIGGNRCDVRIPLRDIDWGIEGVEPAEDTGILDLTVDFAGHSLTCAGTLEATFRTECARCLGPALFEVTEDVRRTYSDRPPEERDLDVYPLETLGSRLSLLEAVKEAVVLSLPTKPLCSPDCPGIHYIQS